MFKHLRNQSSNVGHLKKIVILKTRDITKQKGHYKRQERTNMFETQQTSGQQDGEAKAEMCRRSA